MGLFESCGCREDNKRENELKSNSNDNYNYIAPASLYLPVVGAVGAVDVAGVVIVVNATFVVVVVVENSIVVDVVVEVVVVVAGNTFDEDGVDVVNET